MLLVVLIRWRPVSSHRLGSDLVPQQQSLQWVSSVRVEKGGKGKKGGGVGREKRLMRGKKREGEVVSKVVVTATHIFLLRNRSHLIFDAHYQANIRTFIYQYTNE